MHVPRLYKQPKWQRFIAGFFFGAVISYGIFAYMQGVMYERLLTENQELESTITDLKQENDILSDDKDELDERFKEKVAITSIEIQISNTKQLQIDRLLMHQLEEAIKDEIKDTIGKPLSSVSDNDQLLIKSIENKTFKVDDFAYHMEVQKIAIAKTIRISLKARLA